MTTPTSRAAYKVYYDVLDRAIDSPTGIRVGVGDKGEAHQYRVRLHHARTLDRELNREGRQPTDPGYGTSDYDSLVIKIKEEEGKWWVYIERATVPGTIEELGNGATHTHSTNETAGAVHVHNLRRDLPPKPRAVDDPQLPAIKPRFIRGF